MNTWGTLNTQLTSLLDDTGSTSYPDPLRVIAFNRAMEYFAVQHTAMYKSATAAATAYADGTMVAFPEDFLELPVGGVQPIATTPHWLEPRGVVAGHAVATDGYITLSDGIYLPGGDTEVRLWYYAIYPNITSEASLVYLPRWAEWAVMNLAIAYMLYPMAVNQQMLRQFQSKREAGSPEDNPPRAQMMFHIRLYTDIVGRVKTQDRSILYTPGDRP